jgi:hypothetical protein
MNFYVYIITNNILNKQYVGSRTCHITPVDDNYWGSSKYLNEDYIIFGKENFKKEIIAFYDNKIDMINGESNFIIKHNTLAPNGYNKFIPNEKNGFYTGGKPLSEETKNKIRLKLKNQKRLKPAWNKNKKWSEEIKNKFRKPK